MEAMRGLYDHENPPTPTPTATPTPSPTPTPTNTPTPVFKSVCIQGNLHDAEEETADGDTFTGRTSIELVHDDNTDEDQIVGLRFDNIIVPGTHRVVTSSIVFKAYQSRSGSSDIVFVGELAGDAALYTSGSANFDITGRTPTTASATWSDVPDWTDGQFYISPDLTEPFQQVVDLAAWSSGNAVAWIIEGSGASRQTRSYEGAPSDVPCMQYTHSPATYTPVPTPAPTLTPTPVLPLTAVTPASNNLAGNLGFWFGIIFVIVVTGEVVHAVVFGGGIFRW
jgi:hypothetical protein